MVQGHGTYTTLMKVHVKRGFWLFKCGELIFALYFNFLIYKVFLELEF